MSIVIIKNNYVLKKMDEEGIVIKNNNHAYPLYVNNGIGLFFVNIFTPEEKRSM